MILDPDGLGEESAKQKLERARPHSLGRMTMPVPPEQAANEIAEIGVEGRPADPRSGPVWLWSELGAALGLVVCLTGILGWVLGWAVGVTALAISLIALVLNPVVSATMIRAHDRQVMVRRHDADIGTKASDVKATDDTGDIRST